MKIEDGFKATLRQIPNYNDGAFDGMYTSKDADSAVDDAIADHPGIHFPPEGRTFYALPELSFKPRPRRGTT
jgi:hypothetical protein